MVQDAAGVSHAGGGDDHRTAGATIYFVNESLSVVMRLNTGLPAT